MIRAADGPAGQNCAWQVPFGHTQVAFESLFKGLGKLLLDETAVRADLNNNWAVTAEAIQTILRREGVDGLISAHAIYLGTVACLFGLRLKTPAVVSQHGLSMISEYTGAYELLKEETRGAAVTAESVKAFVKKLEGHATIKLSPVCSLPAPPCPSPKSGWTTGSSLRLGFEPGHGVLTPVCTCASVY